MATGNDLELPNLAIDKYRLDEEWVRQPGEYLRWSMKAADAQKAYDLSKAELDAAVADLNKEIRDRPEDYGLEKITDKAIENTIPACPEYKLATRKVAEARYALEVAKGVVTAFEHRKRSLTFLSELLIRDYYSQSIGRSTPPRMDKAPADELDDDQKRELRTRALNRPRDQEDSEDDRQSDHE